MKNSSLFPLLMSFLCILIYNDGSIKIRNNENAVIGIPVPMDHKYTSSSFVQEQDERKLFVLLLNQFKLSS